MKLLTCALSKWIESRDLGNSHVLPHMAKEQFHVGEAVKDSVCDYSQDVHIETIRISKRREVQPRSPIPHLLIDELHRPTIAGRGGAA
jgi:peptidase E